MSDEVDAPFDSLRLGSQLPHNQSDIVDTLRKIFSLEAELRGNPDGTREAEINKELEILRKKYEEQQFDEATNNILNNMSDKKNMNESIKQKAKGYVQKLLKTLELEDFKDDFILKDLTPAEKDLIINEVGDQMRSYILNNLYEFIVKVFPNFPGLHSIKQMADAHISFKNEAEKKIKNMKMNNDLKEIKSNILINNQLLKLLYQKFIQDTLSARQVSPPTGQDLSSAGQDSSPVEQGSAPTKTVSPSAEPVSPSQAIKGGGGGRKKCRTKGKKNNNKTKRRTKGKRKKTKRRRN